MTLLLPGLLALPAAIAATIEGTVVDTRGNPVAACTITAVNPRFEAVRTTTDDDGQYRFVGIPVGQYRLWAAPGEGDRRLARYHPEARLYCDGTSHWIRRDTSVATANFTLPIGARVTGRILDLDDAPIENAGVIATPMDYLAAQRLGSTDAAGDFTVEGLDVADGGAGQWALQIGVSGWPVQWLGSTYDIETAATFAIGPAGATDVGTHRLLDGIFVAGQVLDPDGPVADATVRVYSSSQLIQTSTDADGRYDVVGLPPGDVLPWATAEGRGATYYPDADRPVLAIPSPSEGDELEDADIEMPFEAIFHGRLVTDDPEADLSKVSVLLYNDTHTVGRGAVADTDGTFTIDQLHGGAYHLFIYAANAGMADAWSRDADGGYRVLTVDHETEMEPVVIPVSPAVRVEGTVIDEDGIPVANAVVLLTDAAAAGPAEESESAHFAHTDGEGYYRVTGLPPGEWDIRTFVDPTCPDDPGFVPIYWPQQVDPILWEPVELLEGDPTFIARFDLPRDDDFDLMSDKWERRYDLDTDRDDSLEDPDDDGLPNLNEYRQGRDPRTADGTWITVQRCGCASSPGPFGVALFAVLIPLARRRADQSSTSIYTA